jgi:hypothetical protein
MTPGKAVQVCPDWPARARRRNDGTGRFRPPAGPFSRPAIRLTNDPAVSKIEDLSASNTGEIIEESFPEKKQ